MSDVMQVARSRCKELEDTIAKREEQIKSARAEIEKLQEFVRFGEGLVNGTATPSAMKTPDNTASADDGDDQTSEKNVLSAVAAARAGSGDAGQAKQSGRMPTRPIVSVAANGAAQG